MPLSQRTCGLIAEAASAYGHAALSTELMKAEIAEGDPGQTDSQGRSIARDKRAAAAVKWAHARRKWDGLINLAEAALNQYAAEVAIPAWAVALTDALRADGFDAVSIQSDAPPPDTWGVSPARRTWSIRPLGDNDAPFATSTSALGVKLKTRGLIVAAHHFEQAFASLKAGRWEASNGQLRAAFENTLVEIAVQKYDWSGSKGGQAIDVLRGKRLLDEHEYDYVRGLWGMSHTNGPHPGMSNKLEAELRMHAVIGALRLLLDRSD